MEIKITPVKNLGLVNVEINGEVKTTAPVTLKEAKELKEFLESGECCGAYSSEAGCCTIK